MDIKEKILTDAEKEKLEADKQPNQEEKCECKCTIDPESDCIKEIDEMFGLINSYIKGNINDMKSNKEYDKHPKMIEDCKEALKLMEMYKNTRLNIELSRKIKFNIDPN